MIDRMWTDVQRRGSIGRRGNFLTFFSDSDPKKLNVSLLTVVVSSSSAMIACDGSGSNSDISDRESRTFSLLFEVAFYFLPFSRQGSRIYAVRFTGSRFPLRSP